MLHLHLTCLNPNQLDYGPDSTKRIRKTSPSRLLCHRANVTGDLAFIKDEDNVLADATAPWFATFFFAATTINLLSTNLRTLDWVSRLTADSLKVSFFGESQFWSESKIYPAVMRIMVPVGSIIILTGIEPVGLADHRFFRRRVREGPLLDDAHRA